MKMKLAAALTGFAMFAGLGQAHAEGELHIYNWGDYTSPELITKFEKQYDVKVTITDYDANDTAIAKVRAGGHGFDIAVPSASYVPIWINEGPAAGVKAGPDGEFQKHGPALGRCAFRSGPPLHGALAMGHQRHPRQHQSSTRAIPTPPPFSLTRRMN